MAAGLGFKTFTTGEVLTAADTNGYLMQGINVFASSAARAAAITSPQEGQYSYLKDTNALEYYDGAAWVGAPVGDITAVTAGKGLTGGGSSGDVTVSLATTAKGDLVAGSGASTAAVLSVGTNGQYLQADSTAATGLKWATVSSSPTFSGCFLAKSASQNVTSTNVYVALTFDLETYDTNSYHSTSSNTSRITVPNTGYYRFTFNTLVSTVYLYRFGFFKNGAQLNTGFGYAIPQGGGGMVNASIDVSLTANDYVEIFGYVASTTDFYGNNSFTVPTYFSCQYLGA